MVNVDAHARLGWMLLKSGKGGYWCQEITMPIFSGKLFRSSSRGIPTPSQAIKANKQMKYHEVFIKIDY